jgi:hypothetical protein
LGSPGTLLTNLSLITAPIALYYYFASSPIVVELTKGNEEHTTAFFRKYRPSDILPNKAIG